MRSNLTAYVAAWSAVFAFACGGRGSPTSDPDAAGGVADAPSDARAHVTLRTLVTRGFVSAGAGGAIDAAATAAGPAATFALVDLDGGALRDGDAIQLVTADDRALSAVAGGGGALTTVATAPGADETFVIARVAGPGAIQPGDYVSLATAGGAHFVSAVGGGGGEVRADAPWARAWEQFAISIDGASAPPGGTPRQRVLAYLASVSGHRTIAGQHNKYNATPSDATDQIVGITGKTPGLWSADFGFGQDALDHREGMIAEAIAQWRRGALVQLMYHNCIPTRDELCGWDDIGGQTPQHLTDDQWTALITDGTALNTAWKSRLDGLLPRFRELEAAGVAPLFRPLHEMNQGIFWWGGRGGPDGTRRLFQITHDYLAAHGIDNLIWVWDVQDFATLADDVVAYDPGPDAYDVAALDVYDGGYTAGNYAVMRAAAGARPIAIGECATLPTAAELAAQPAWVFFMLWPDFVDQDRQALPPLYGAANVVTEDEMPGWQ